MSWGGVTSFFRPTREEKTPPDQGGVVSTENEGKAMLNLAKLGSENKAPTKDSVFRWIQNPPETPIRMVIAPDLASEMLKHNTDNRPISLSTVEKYAAQMKRGEWRLTFCPIVFSRAGRLSDGQHRLMACVRAGVPFEVWVAFGDEDSNFAFIDIGKPRGASDIFAIHGVKNWALMAAATRWVMAYDNNLMSGGSSGLSFSPTPAQVYDFYEQNKKMAESARIGHLFAQSRLSQPGMVVGLHYICARKNRGQADDFFEKLATGLGFTSKNEPVYRLHKRLVENVTKNERLKPIVIAAFTVKAWNAMRTNQPLGVFRWRTEQNPQEAFPKAV